MNHAPLFRLILCPALAAYCIACAGQGVSARPPSQKSAGIVEGVITFRGEVPKSRIPDDAGVQRDLLRVDREGGVQNVVAWLVPKNNTASKPEAKTETPAAVAQMDQRDSEFIPRVLAIQSGQRVRFSNSDPANHNVRTSSSQHSNEFNVFTGAEGSYAHRFTVSPQQQPVRVGCDIHPWMRGWIYVFEHPHFAVTDERGAFRIDSIPVGDYELFAEQPDVRFKERRALTISNAEPVKVNLEIRAKISAANE